MYAQGRINMRIYAKELLMVTTQIGLDINF